MTDQKEKPSVTCSEGHVGTYMNVAEAKAFARKGQPLGDPKFSASFVIAPEHPDFVAIKTAVFTLLKENLPGKKLVFGRRLTQEEANAGAMEVNVPWRKGEEEIARLTEAKKDFKPEMYAGKMIVKASSKYQPALGILEKGGLKSLTTDEAIKVHKNSHFYSGAYYLPKFSLNFYAAKGRDPGGVNLFLDGVIFIKNGERIGGKSRTAAEMFSGYVGKISQEDPTAGAADVLGDEIPL